MKTAVIVNRFHRGPYRLYPIERARLARRTMRRRSFAHAAAECAASILDPIRDARIRECIAALEAMSGPDAARADRALSALAGEGCS